MTPQRFRKRGGGRDLSVSDRQLQADLAEAMAIPKHVPIVPSPREQAGGKGPVGSHCHLVAIWTHCTGSEFCHQQLYYGPGKKFIFLSHILRKAGDGTGQFHLQVIQLSRYLLGPTLCWMPRQNRKESQSERIQVGGWGLSGY